MFHISWEERWEYIFYDPLSVDVISLGKLNWKGMYRIYICLLAIFFFFCLLLWLEKLVIKLEAWWSSFSTRKMFWFFRHCVWFIIFLQINRNPQTKTCVNLLFMKILKFYEFLCITHCSNFAQINSQFTKKNGFIYQRELEKHLFNIRFIEHSIETISFVLKSTFFVVVRT